MPCPWTVYPAPLGGVIATTTIMNYDEQYAAEHTEKGAWIGGNWPPGVVKMDWTVFGGFDSELTTQEILPQILDNEESRIGSMEETVLGRHPAVLTVTESRVNPSDQGLVVAYRLDANRILLAGILPMEAFDYSDVQGILASIAFSPEEEIAVPAFPPEAPLIEIPPACRAG